MFGCSLTASLLGCDSLGPDGVLEPDSHRLRPLPQPSDGTGADTPGPAPSGTLAGPSLLEADSLDRGIAQLKRAVGGNNTDSEISVLELRATPERLLLQAEDPTHEGRVLQWEYTRAGVRGPIEVELRGNGDLKENLYSLDGVYLKAIPRLTSIAVSHVDPQDGRVTSIVIRRNLPFTQDVRFRVFVNSPRKNGQLDANRFGHPLLG